MDYILLNENTRQLYHTSEDIYQLLIQKFSFSSNIYLAIKNMIITTLLIMMLLISIVHILNFCFEFINPSWLLNSKRQTNETSYQVYEDILLQRNIGEKQVLTPTLSKFLPILVPCIVQHLMKLISYQELIKFDQSNNKWHCWRTQFIGCGSFSWIFKMIRRSLLKYFLNKFSILQAYQFKSFAHNKLQNKQDTLVMDFMQKSMNLI